MQWGTSEEPSVSHNEKASVRGGRGSGSGNGGFCEPVILWGMAGSEKEKFLWDDQGWSSCRRLMALGLTVDSENYRKGKVTVIPIE